MSNARFIFSNDWDSASLVLTQGTQAPALPLVHTQRYNNSRTFRTQGTGDATIVFTLPDPRVLSGLVLWRHNLTTAAKIRLELFDQENATGVKVYDSGLFDAIEAKTLGDLQWGLEPLGATTFSDWDLAYSVKWFELTAAKSGRLTISDPSNPDGFLEVCRVYLGRALEPKFNVDLGHSLRWETMTKGPRTAGGTIHTLETQVFRSLEFDLSHLEPGERSSWFDEVRRVSTHRDFFISLRPEVGGSTERDYAFAAKFDGLPPFVSQPGRYAVKFNLKEA